MKKAFTLIELVVAVALLAMMLAFSGIIFKVSIESYRTAVANAEIMQKLRAITDQLNADFKGLAKDGYLILHCNIENGSEYQGYVPGNFRADRLYYFSTGDFQSWFRTDRSNIARIYFGHDSNSLDPPGPVADRLVSRWNLARDAVLVTPGITPTDPNFDYINISYAQTKANIPATLADANGLLVNGVRLNIERYPNDIRRLMCQNVGWMQIEWADPNGSVTGGKLNWWGMGNPIAGIFAVAISESASLTYYKANWDPSNRAYWPKALKFTFTLYDSRNIIKGGRMFTHIVYLD